MPRVPIVAVAPPKQESVSLVTTKTTACPVTRESGLVQQDHMQARMTPTRVETKLKQVLIMETNTSKPWDIF